MDEYAGHNAMMLWQLKMKNNLYMLNGLRTTMRNLKQLYELRETIEIYNDIKKLDGIIQTATMWHERGRPWIGENLDTISATVEAIKQRHLTQ